MKKILVIMSIVALFIGLFLIYEYPIQRALAMNKFYKYIKLKGASVENIVDMEVFKDYKMGGYEIKLKYKDDIENTYFYHYEPIYFFKNEIRGNRVFLDDVFTKWIKGDDEGNRRREENVKYKPLEDK